MEPATAASAASQKGSRDRGSLLMNSSREDSVAAWSRASEASVNRSIAIR